MPWIEPDLDTVIRVGWILTALGVVIFVVSLVGEILGWWELGGEVGMWIGALLTVVVGFGTAVTTASRDQAAGIDARLRSVHSAVEGNGTKLDKLDKLDVIERALVAQDGETSRLDVVQVELDRQTHVLDRQVGLLTEIRDRL